MKIDIILMISMSYPNVEKFVLGQWGCMSPFSPETQKKMVSEYAEHLVKKMDSNPDKGDLHCMMLGLNFPVLGDIDIGADLKDKARDGEKDMIHYFLKAYKKDCKSVDPPGSS
jgi:hypothetical protein